MLRRGAGIAARTVAWLACTLLVSGCSHVGPNNPQRQGSAQQISQIAYVASDDHIYISEADGSNPRQVSRQVGGLSSTQGWSYRWPTYSPDGKRLAFA